MTSRNEHPEQADRFQSFDQIGWDAALRFEFGGPCRDLGRQFPDAGRDGFAVVARDQRMITKLILSSHLYRPL
jgi:hypothetical protein